jgi:hypothetical protein
MRSTLIPAITAALTLCASAQTSTPLFDGKSLTGWYTFLEKEGKNQDKEGAFRIVDGVIRISGSQLGYLSTEKEYANYQITFSYRWANTAAIEGKRNSGIIYHATGEDRRWCNGIECQMQEGDAGDLWLIPGSGNAAAITVKDEAFGGTNKAARVFKWEANERPLGAWNEMSVVCRGKEFEHWVNGKKVIAGVTKDRDKGKIQFQCEGHEVWLRDIRITEFNKTP